MGASAVGSQVALAADHASSKWYRAAGLPSYPYMTRLPPATRHGPSPQSSSDRLGGSDACVVIAAAPTIGRRQCYRPAVSAALNRNVERVFNSSRKDTHWGKRKLKRTDIEGCYTCTVCGRRGAEIRPDWQS